MKLVAITGLPASGKSTVCRLLKEAGAQTLSADELAHEILTPNTKQGRQAIQLLGPNIVRQGAIDRKQVASIVFQNAVLLEQLEKILHPEIKRRVLLAIERKKREGSASIFAIEIPLLFEKMADLVPFFDATLLVLSDEATMKKRYLADDYEKRASFHFSQEEKQRASTHTIGNSSSIEALKQQVDQFIQKLT